MNSHFGKYQIIDMPKLGKEEGVNCSVPVFRYDMEIEAIQIPYCCNIEKVIIFYGDIIKTRNFYDRKRK